MTPIKTPYDDRIAELEPNIYKRESAMKLWHLFMDMRMGYEIGYADGFKTAQQTCGCDEYAGS